MKKAILSLAIVCALLLCVLPFTADAAESAGTLSLGVKQELTATEDTEYVYTFTAPETGIYVLWAEESEDFSLWFDIYDSDDNNLDWGNRIQFYANAGKSYSIYTSLTVFNSDGVTAAFTLDKGVPITSLTFSKPSYTGFVGETLDIEVAYAPANGIIDIDWSSSNEAVADLWSYSSLGGASFELLSTGTVTITATYGQGKTATCTVNATAPASLSNNDTVTVNLPAGGRVGFLFTAPEDGPYYFEGYFANDIKHGDITMDLSGRCYDLDDEYVFGGYTVYDGLVYCGCFQGEDYLVILENNTDKAYTFAFGVYQAVPATSLTIESGADSVEAFVEEWIGVTAEFGPERAITEKVTWTSSDPGILEIMYQWSGYCELYAHAEGTVTLTATSESGLTDSITVIVTEFEWNLSGDPITLNKPHPVVINGPDDEAIYEFVPSQSGYYQFDHDADEYAAIGVVVNNEEQIAAFYLLNDMDGLVLWLDAGNTYYIYSYYMDLDTVGTYNIYLRKLPAATNGWVQCNKGWYYYINGELASEWQKINGQWYYFRYNEYFSVPVFGSMITGWKEIDGNQYYFDNAMVTGWKQIDGCWYYFGADGAMVTGWAQVGSTWYYFDSEGVMLTGWQKIDGSWYYLGTNGAMVTGWQKIGGSWYYFSAGGMMQTGWEEIGGTWYYLSSSGSMVTGWQKIDSKWYYFSAGGAMQSGWLQLGGQWYYLGNDMKTGWASIGGKWYYFSSGGSMLKGWQKLDGTWYYLNSDMKTGWQKIDGSWYYFSAGGAMQTGWQKLNGSWYYLGTNGVMVTGTHVIDGKSYTFNSSGVWIG